MNTKSKEIMLENYITDDSVVDAIELRDKLNLSTPEFIEVIKKSMKRGNHIACVDGMLFQARNRKEFEKNLVKIWEMRRKNGIIEYGGTTEIHAVKKEIKKK